MMPGLSYEDNQLHIDGIAIQAIAQKYGTPCYIYSLHTILSQLKKIQLAFSAHPTHVFYAVKANNNLAILQQMAKTGIGFDVVSGGELMRVLKAGAASDKIIFSGVGKRKEELAQAIENNIHCINVESEQELQQILRLANHYQKKINIALRINPNIAANTHKNITTGLTENKFGIMPSALEELIPHLRQPNINCIGIACHIGSQITEVEPYADATRKMTEIVERLREKHIMLSHLDLGGGFGIPYHAETLPDIKQYAEAMLPLLKPHSLQLYLEPGRFLLGPAACLVSQVIYTKKHHAHHFAIIDAGMNDLMRPALYGAKHQIHPVLLRPTEKTVYDIVGPVCESTDCFREAYPITLLPEDYLVFDSVGAYGTAMSSRYNARPLIPEVLVANGHAYLIRERETLEDTYQLERMLDIIGRDDHVYLKG